MPNPGDLVALGQTSIAGAWLLEDRPAPPAPAVPLGELFLSSVAVVVAVIARDDVVGGDVLLCSADGTGWLLAGARGLRTLCGCEPVAPPC